MLVGDWEVEATVPGGGNYSGLVVGRAVGDTVELEWDITSGRYVGVGLEVRGAWYVACGEDWEGLGLALVRVDGRVRWSPAPEAGEVGATILVPSGVRRWEAGPETAPGFPFDSVSLAGTKKVMGSVLSRAKQKRSDSEPLACRSIRSASARRLAMTLASRRELEYRMQGRMSAWHFR